ncbi:hypothetical protein HY095_00715 [Candidatus Micrarchaeota archaeon]|nr:hypothetical protein [Candidatus Micrarchaeota archaeon]
MEFKPVALAAIVLSLAIAGCVSQTRPAPAPQATVLPRATAAPTAIPAPQARCIGSPIRDYFNAGSINATDAAGTVQKFSDFCINQTALSEYYCNGDEKGVETYACGYGCEAGACRTAAQATPTHPISFALVSSPKNAYITPCQSPEITLNVLGAPGHAGVRFFAKWGGKLSGSFNPEEESADTAGFAETKVAVSAACASTGTAIANFTAQVCTQAECANKTIGMTFTAGHCANNEAACDANGSIAG